MTIATAQLAIGTIWGNTTTNNNTSTINTNTTTRYFLMGIS